jgi:hypothetical protein
VRFNICFLISSAESDFTYLQFTHQL